MINYLKVHSEEAQNKDWQIIKSQFKKKKKSSLTIQKIAERGEKVF